MAGWLWATPEIKDDRTILPRDMQMVYEDPFGLLKSSETSKPWEIRDSFRQLVCSSNPNYVAMVIPKNLTYLHIVIAFFLATEFLPQRATVVKDFLDNDIIMKDLSPQDIIPRLRPLPPPTDGKYMVYKTITYKFILFFFNSWRI